MLDKIVNGIKKRSEYSIMVDMDRDSLRRAASIHEDIFKLKTTYIELTTPDCSFLKSEIQSLMEAYNNSLPENILTACNEIFSHYEEFEKQITP
ncbi:hypothetical protein LJC25_01980 [Bacteroidales bacterium OttesenSCG-928-K03]|nr:hypothetical protein [Bacteroidales bacterium OttesenSCG-928-K03]